MKINAPNKGKSWGQVQIGTSSLVLIFTVLCLVVFSTLSLASAEAEHRLAEKNQQHVADYYLGDSKAEVILKEIDNRLGELRSMSGDEAYFQQLLAEEFKESYEVDANQLTYTVDSGKEQFILVQLEPLYEKVGTETNKNCRIKAWIVKNKMDYEIYDDIPVWDGSGME